MLQANFTPSRMGTMTSLKTTMAYFGTLCVVFGAARGEVCWPQTLTPIASSHATATKLRAMVDEGRASRWVRIQELPRRSRIIASADFYRASPQEKAQTDKTQSIPI